MPLIVQPDGSLIEGPIPSGGTKVLALDQGEIKEVYVAVNPPAVGGEVVNEKLTYDLPEIFPRGIPLNSLILYVSEGFPPLTEEVVAALLAKAEETLNTVVDYPTIEVAPISDIVPDQLEAVSIIPTSNEFLGLVNDDIEAVIMVLDETVEEVNDTITLVVAPINTTVPDQVDTLAIETNSLEINKKAIDTLSLTTAVSDVNFKPVETIRITADITAAEILSDLQEDVAATIVVSPDLTPLGEDTITVATVVSEVAEVITDDINITATVTASEILAELQEDTAAAIVVGSEIVPQGTDLIVLEASLNGYANAVASNTGFTNPNNALGNTTNTAATLTATSSGLVGTTNNTTNGTIQLDFQDVNLGDLTISSVNLFVETQHANAGVPITQPTTTLQYQYSTNNGGSYTTFYTQTANTGKAIRTIDITAIVGQNQTLLSQLRIRATGNVTSGTGLGAGSTASFFRAWMVVEAQRSYT